MKRDLIACLPLVFAAALGAWQAFPIFDDGYYLLLLREGGPQAFVSAHLDRPLYGWLLGWTAAWLGESAAALAIFSSLVWLWLALLTGQLWRETFPRNAEWSPLAAVGVVAPVWVQVQLSTVTVVLPDVLPIALALAGALGLKRGNGIAALAFFVVAATLSEYGLCGALALAPWMYSLVGPRRLIAAALVTAAAFLLFLGSRRTTGVRRDVTALHAAESLAAAPAEAPLRLARGLARIVAGAPLAAMAVEGPRSERPRAAAAAWAFAALAGLVLWMGCPPPGDYAPESWSPLWPLIGGAVLALLPVVAFGRDPAEGGFGSRFQLPALPLTAMLFPALLLRGLQPWAWRPAAALIGLTFGLAAFQETLDASDHGRAMSRLGARLIAQAPANGYVVARVDAGRGERWAPGSPYMLTAQAERALPEDARGRLWLTNSWAADDCPDELDWRGRGITRRSSVGACFRAWVLPDGSPRLESLSAENRKPLVIP